MKELKVFIGIILLAMPLSVFAGYSPAKVQAALKKMYPQATDIAWSQQNGYYVADFISGELETDVWFNPQGIWIMTLIDMQTTDNLPSSVYNSFAMGEYASWTVDDVKQAIFPNCPMVYVIKVGQPNVDVLYQLFFLSNGTLIKTFNPGYDESTLSPLSFDCW